jgi:hypothetical protein
MENSFRFFFLSLLSFIPHSIQNFIAVAIATAIAMEPPPASWATTLQSVLERLIDFLPLLDIDYWTRTKYGHVLDKLKLTFTLTRMPILIPTLRRNCVERGWDELG